MRKEYSGYPLDQQFLVLLAYPRPEEGSTRVGILMRSEGKRQSFVKLITVSRNDIFGCEGS